MKSDIALVWLRKKLYYIYFGRKLILYEVVMFSALGKFEEYWLPAMKKIYLLFSYKVKEESDFKVFQWENERDYLRFFSRLKLLVMFNIKYNFRRKWNHPRKMRLVHPMFLSSATLYPQHFFRWQIVGWTICVKISRPVDLFFGDTSSDGHLVLWHFA